MGRNAKTRKARKPQRITLTGEQAEVFDEQMDSDRDWFQGSDECVRFRPEIEGEFNEQKMLGKEPPFIQLFDTDSGEDMTLSLDWVCVIEISRITTGENAGLRTRMRCPAPTSGALRELMSDYAISYARGLVRIMQDMHKRKPKGV